MQIANIIGYTGGAFTILGMAAQVRHSFVKKNFKELSVNRLAADLVTNSLNLAYGGMISSIPVCLTAASVVIASVVLGTCYVWVSYETRETEIDDGAITV